MAYQRCSRWVFQILGKKNRRPFPACIYAKICERFASLDGLYTHFKYAKTSKRYCLCVSIILCINNTVQISLVMYQICFSIDDTYGSKFHAAQSQLIEIRWFGKAVNFKGRQQICCATKDAEVTCQIVCMLSSDKYKTIYCPLRFTQFFAAFVHENFTKTFLRKTVELKVEWREPTREYCKKLKK